MLTNNIISFEQLGPDHLAGEEGAGCFPFLWFVACVLSVCLSLLLMSTVDYGR